MSDLIKWYYFQIASSNVVEAALALARKVGSTGTKGRKTSEMPIKDADQAEALVQGIIPVRFIIDY